MVADGGAADAERLDCLAVEVFDCAVVVNARNAATISFPALRTKSDCFMGSDARVGRRMSNMECCMAKVCLNTEAPHGVYVSHPRLIGAILAE